MVNPDFTIFPLLTTQRLVLRQLRINDADEILALRSDKKVNEFLDRPRAINKKDARDFIKKIQKGIKNNECIYWVITLKEKDILTGTICCWNFSFEKSTAEIGYELLPDFQGKGIMQEAISAIIDWGFNKMKLDIITALTKKENKNSIRILIKNNFKPDKKYKYVCKDNADGLDVYYLAKPI
jgi:RimJ/RimL family protein N-acetyltransferase